MELLDGGAAEPAAEGRQLDLLPHGFSETKTTKSLARETPNQPIAAGRGGAYTWALNTTHAIRINSR